DVGAEPRPPDLDERRILPRPGLRPVDPGMDRDEGRPRHAVRKAAPRRAPQRFRAGRQPPVERPGCAAVAEDLLPRQLDRRRHQPGMRPFIWRAIIAAAPFGLTRYRTSMSFASRPIRTR